MYVIYFIIESFVLTVLTILVARSPKFCEHYNELPNKFIINNRLSNFLLLKPKYPTTKWFFILVITQIISFFISTILCVLYWLGVYFIGFLNSYVVLIVYLVFFTICFVPIGLLNSIIINKYIFNSQK